MRALMSSALLVALALLMTGCATATRPEQAITLDPGMSKDVSSPPPQYFTFTLSRPSQVTIESETFPGNEYIAPYIVLLNEEQQEVARDWSSGRRSNFRLQERLSAGKWYVRVHDPFNGSCGLCNERNYRYSVTLQVDESAL